MGEVVNFNSKTNKIEFDCILSDDSYLNIASLNMLQSAGYHVNRDGVLQFQKDHKLKQDGIMSIDMFPDLLMYLDPNSRQDILNYMERNKFTIRENNMKKKKINYTYLILTLIGILFFELYGIISCAIDIYHLFVK